MPRLQTSRYSDGSTQLWMPRPSVWSIRDRGLSGIGVTQADAPVPVVITAYSDKTFTYVRSPPIPALNDVTSSAATFEAILRRLQIHEACLAAIYAISFEPVTAILESRAKRGGCEVTWCVVQVTKTPPTTYFLKKAAGIESGSQRPGHQSVATISAKHVYEIAKVKQQDSKDVPLESMCRNIVGTCRSMGIKVVGGFEAPAS